VVEAASSYPQFCLHYVRIKPGFRAQCTHRLTGKKSDDLRSAGHSSLGPASGQE